MIGRLDDYLREVAADNKAPVSESDIRQAGLAATKRAYKIYRERGYEAVLLVAALRGSYHLTELAGADLIMSIAPGSPGVVHRQGLSREKSGSRRKSPPDVVQRLSAMPEFVKAYEPDGMAPNDFITYGPTQRTLFQFVEAGWKLLEGVK